ncbi:hypothetical protein [Methanoculleus sp.]|uniref:PKD domain-containing protein n=1 Tax=Methanoculleus sp. TaxID=90427 RepID=UPI0025E517BE|nr:hypothetical protein [Methanoculleus sp.]
MKRNTTIRVFSLLIALAVAIPAVQAALTVDAGSDRTILAGEPITILATFNGTDSFDAMNISASINWSTGTTEAEIVPDDGHNGTIQATHTYVTAGTYAVTVKVADNLTGAAAYDTLNVTVNRQPAEMKVVPKTLNEKGNGVSTVFVNLAEWLGFARTDRTNMTTPDPSEFRIGNATPERINFCMKDGGTLILKYRRADLDPAASDGNLTVIGNGAISAINPGNGQKGEFGNHNGHAGNAKEKVKNQKEFREEHQKQNRNANKQAS